jgi:hypothetical protein
MNTPDASTELQQLKKQIAGLRQEMDALTRHFGVETFESGGKNVNISCTALTLLNSENPAQIQGMLCGGSDGPELTFWGPDQKARLSVRLDKDGVPSIQLFEAEGPLAVHIGRDNLGMTSVGVLNQGRPRAAIKASEGTGVISAVHNGGQARVTILGHEAAGEILLVNPDMKVAMKLTTEGQHGGGLFTVNHSNGKAAVIATALPDYGCVLVSDRAGQMKYSLPDPGNI